MLLQLLFGVLSVAAQSSSPAIQSVSELAIAGRVVGESGEPLPRIHILPSYPGETIIVGTHAVTNQEGEFKVSGLKPSEYRICADPGPNVAIIRGDRRPLGEQPLRACQAISLQARSLSRIEITLRRGLLYSVRGSVIDAEGNAMRATGFTVAMRDSPPPWSINAEQASDGRFTRMVFHLATMSSPRGAPRRTAGSSS